MTEKKLGELFHINVNQNKYLNEENNSMLIEVK